MLRFVNTLTLYRYGLKASWVNAEVHRPFDGKVQNVTLIPGIGIGPEITSRKYLNFQTPCWMYSRLLMFLFSSIY